MLWLLFVPFVVQAAQAPFRSSRAPSTAAHDFTLKVGPDRFTPQDLIELARPGAGVANAPGSLVLVPISKYSFADKKCVGLYQ
jgi:hypothetical protein